MVTRIVVVSLLLAAVSCSKPPSKSASSASNGGSELVKVEETYYPERSSKRKKNRSWSQIVESLESSAEYRKLEGEFVSEVPSEMQFSGIATQHISTKEHNPFGDRDRFIVPLSKMESTFVYPLKGEFLSNYGMRRGRMHTGVDIRGKRGEEIYAAFDGVVRLSRPYSGYGNVIVVRHYNGLETVYSHNHKNLVKVNQTVKAGEAIALAGRTGRATTDHLHFEVRIAGQVIDPNLLIDVHGHKLQSQDLYVSRASAGSKVYVTKGAYREFSKAEKSPAPKKTATKDTKSSGKTHTVTSGDTLYGIARKYSTTVKELCRLNGISENSTLRLGQKIKVK